MAKQEVTGDDARFEIAENLVIVWAEITSLKEQDVNAQVMQPKKFERLTENIRKRGQIESLPYCWQKGGKGPIEIVSGHHRVRAARAAGLTKIPILLDTSEFRRGEVTAKQIAHNELHGSPDEDVLAQLVASLETVDDLLATGLDEDWLPTVDRDDTVLGLPSAVFDWRTVTLLFLPAQLADFQAAVDMLDKNAEVLGLAKFEQYQEFADAAYRFGRFRNIRNFSTTVMTLTEIARQQIEADEQSGVQPDSNWIRTDELVGPQVPPDVADIVRLAVEKAQKSGVDSPWQALEVIAAEYLAGA